MILVNFQNSLIQLLKIFFLSQRQWCTPDHHSISKAFRRYHALHKRLVGLFSRVEVNYSKETCLREYMATYIYASY